MKRSVWRLATAVLGLAPMTLVPSCGNGTTEVYNYYYDLVTYTVEAPEGAFDQIFSPSQTVPVVEPVPAPPSPGDTGGKG